MSKHYKSRREAAGYTIDQMAAATETNAQWLAAIEREDYGQIPADIDIQEYIRQYSHFVGTPVEEGLDRFEEYLKRNPREAMRSRSTPLNASDASPIEKAIHHALVASSQDYILQNIAAESTIEKSGETQIRKREIAKVDESYDQAEKHPSAIKASESFDTVAGDNRIEKLDETEIHEKVFVEVDQSNELAVEHTLEKMNSEASNIAVGDTRFHSGVNTVANRRFLYIGAPVLILIALVVYQSLQLKKAEKPVQMTPDIRQTIVAEKNVQQPKKQAASVADKQAAGNKFAVSSTKSHTLVISADESCWIQVISDQTEKKEYLMKPGDKLTFRAANTMNVIVGNAGGVLLTFDGQTLPGGEKDEVLHFDLPQKVRQGKRVNRESPEETASPAAGHESSESKESFHEDNPGSASSDKSAPSEKP